MVLDAAKSMKEQTRKLFEVCSRSAASAGPIITLVNKLATKRDPFDLISRATAAVA
jgi:peptide subunit release factor RF-3